MTVHLLEAVGLEGFALGPSEREMRKCGAGCDDIHKSGVVWRQISIDSVFSETIDHIFLFRSKKLRLGL